MPDGPGTYPANNAFGRSDTAGMHDGRGGRAAAPDGWFSPSGDPYTYRFVDGETVEFYNPATGKRGQIAVSKIAESNPAWLNQDEVKRAAPVPMQETPQRAAAPEPAGVSPSAYTGPDDPARSYVNGANPNSAYTGPGDPARHYKGGEATAYTGRDDPARSQSAYTGPDDPARTAPNNMTANPPESRVPAKGYADNSDLMNLFLEFIQGAGPIGQAVEIGSKVAPYLGNRHPLNQFR